jgi:hypothetical protein
MGVYTDKPDEFKSSVISNSARSLSLSLSLSLSN